MPAGQELSVIGVARDPQRCETAQAPSASPPGKLNVRFLCADLSSHPLKGNNALIGLRWRVRSISPRHRLRRHSFSAAGPAVKGWSGLHGKKYSLRKPLRGTAHSPNLYRVRAEAVLGYSWTPRRAGGSAISPMNSPYCIPQSPEPHLP